MTALLTERPHLNSSSRVRIRWRTGAREWRLATADTQNVAGGEGPALPDPQTLQPWPSRPCGLADTSPPPTCAPQTPAPGRATAWVTTPLQLLNGEPSNDLARFITLVDTANGIAVRRSPGQWMFPNVDLTIHLHRQPTGDWVGLDTTVIFGAAGHGLTSTVLHDLLGPVGRAAPDTDTSSSSMSAGS